MSSVVFLHLVYSMLLPLCLPLFWCLLVLLSGHEYSLESSQWIVLLCYQVFVFTIQKASVLNLVMTNTNEELYSFYCTWYLLYTCQYTQTLSFGYVCVFCKQNTIKGSVFRLPIFQRWGDSIHSYPDSVYN